MNQTFLLRDMLFFNKEINKNIYINYILILYSLKKMLR